MTTESRNLTRIVVYWDRQAETEGWAYRLSDDQGDIASGGIFAAGDDLDAAIGEAVRESGLDLDPDMFAREPELEGGFAIWSA